jgi:hypothetical protein
MLRDRRRQATATFAVVRPPPFRARASTRITETGSRHVRRFFGDYQPRHLHDLDAALAARPGRVDQAIEVPVPDPAGREKLIHLYGKTPALSDTILRAVAKRTEGASAAELMRRKAKACLERQGDGAVTLGDANQALDDMLFTSGRLDSALLGGQGAAGHS